jgi:ABC-type antimicrobial peptide transport system permease subunit
LAVLSEHPSRRDGIGKQVVLPWRQSLRICAASIRVRFGRSLLTLLGVVLAVAFMTAVVTTSRITDRVLETGDANTLFVLAKATGIDVNNPNARQDQRVRNIWLITLSVLVALVGITNSVLMSVTERFREIGTMKCLGALDSFIVRLYFLESAFAGLIGAGIGAPVGIGLAIVRMGWSLGSNALDGRSLLVEGMLTFGIALVVGMLITVAAAIYPAYVAARMQPIEAMRARE